MACCARSTSCAFGSASRGCIIRQLSAALSRRWPAVQWRRSTIIHRPGKDNHCRGQDMAGLSGLPVKPNKVRYDLKRRDPKFKDEDGGSSVRLPRGQNH